MDSLDEAVVLGLGRVWDEQQGGAHRSLAIFRGELQLRLISNQTSCLAILLMLNN